MPPHGGQNINLGQVQLANNQTVNSWFVQRLKSILAGQVQPTEANGGFRPIYVNPQAQSKVNAALKVENGFFGQDLKRYENGSQPVQGISPAGTASQKQQQINN